MEQSIFGKTEAGDSSGDTVATTPGDTMDVDVNVRATADTPDTADVDVDVDVDMADKPPNDDDNEESSDRDSLPDLTDIEARHLRKTPNHEVKTTERQGLLYSGFFRQLQLKPQKYLEFYNGVIWPLRYNHIEEIQRGTPAGYRAFTNRLLRGYGYIIWPSNSAPTSEWLIDVEDLDEGDVRLTYVKPTGRNGASTVPENARFCTILDALWARMRNAIFTRRTQTTAPNRRVRARQNSNKARCRQSSSFVDDNETDYDDIEGIRNNTISPQTFLERARGRTQQTVLNSQATTTTTMAHANANAAGSSNQKLTYEELDQALDRLQATLSDIRERSDPDMFASLWEEKIMRLDEIEAGLPQDPALVAMFDRSIARGDMPAPPPGPGPVMCNEPFNSRGNPSRDINLNIPPTIPGTMSVWVNVADMPAVALNEADIITTGFGDLSIGGGDGGSSHHWVDAPVDQLDMERFIKGVNERITPTPSKVMGYVLSYGWNDSCRFISTGQFETCGRILSSSSTSTTTVASSSSSVGPSSTDFPPQQWSVIRQGWSNFRNDLERAALDGVKIWRIKVCVVALP
ncbi:hypothetical protein H2204_013082 [Knufia peltigerae]|uniref:Uncharacterized protein n=1 Tax=Knufia peltigerae TaxID=1002370 RepID=A0AA39CSD4_9EURO|nr:hypothetical protein H2204_013082 [Knufia peltigerae]